MTCGGSIDRVPWQIEGEDQQRALHTLRALVDLEHNSRRLSAQSGRGVTVLELCALVGACGIEVAVSGGMAIATAYLNPEIQEEPLQFGSYRVMNRIAEGGTGAVFRAENPKTGSAVALKTVRTGLAHEVAVLTHEIATLRELRHPGIVRFLDDGTTGGMPWMAVELLGGRTLFEVISDVWDEEDRRAGAESRDRRRELRSHGDRRHERTGQQPLTVALTDSAPSAGNWIFSLQEDPSLDFPSRRAAAGKLQDALLVVMRMLPALEYIHSRGITHGDVKPPNVQLGDDGRVTLLDFGAAHLPRNRRKSAQFEGPRMGTMEYAAPEQILGERIDAATDIYALGCILYELVTGRIPFEGSTGEQIAEKHLVAQAQCPSELVSGLPWELEELIMDMLSKKPSERPRGVRAVATRLAPLLRRCQQ